MRVYRWKTTAGVKSQWLYPPSRMLQALIKLNTWATNMIYIIKDKMKKNLTIKSIDKTQY